MSCNSCAKPFSLLRKEKGCPNCGFSYCSKCLFNKVFVAKLNAEAKVCTKCKNSITNNEQNVQKNQIIPPDTFIKRQAEADISTVKSGNSTDDHILERLNKLKKENIKMAPEDEISDRLKNLKGETPSTSDAELRARLARLRGLPETISTKPSLPVQDLRTEQEQIDDLMKQYMDQTQIDTKYKDEFDTLVSDMESRINKLKGSNATATEIPTAAKVEHNSESDDEDTVVKKIVEKIKTEALVEDNEIAPPTNDELPFCEICNEDARMRCLGCKYLFCKRCFMDHRDDDDGCNRYEPYQPPKTIN